MKKKSLFELNEKVLRSSFKIIFGVRTARVFELKRIYRIRFARVSSHVADFNARNKSLTAKLLQQDYRYHKLRKTFSKFYRRHYELVSNSILD